MAVLMHIFPLIINVFNMCSIFDFHWGFWDYSHIKADLHLKSHFVLRCVIPPLYLTNGRSFIYLFIYFLLSMHIICAAKQHFCFSHLGEVFSPPPVCAQMSCRAWVPREPAAHLRMRQFPWQSHARAKTATRKVLKPSLSETSPAHEQMKTRW